ncbi:hypothetical protein EJ08DRAFT_638369 [Tothia fuscella]|uniref:Glycosyl transferase CAP10 domain-containing protein n=1 Tax=Tothia fuscella TaxID=1048955 RepID=A0A9P4NLH7_9PEZI|nr:hypothetical protein EJ08DRAFT_638369 [Tothia fuscella]
MREFNRFRIGWVASGAAVVSLALVWFTFFHEPTVSPVPLKVYVGVPTSGDGDWEFDSRRDARNLGLLDDQCDIAFPKLYTELDRAKYHLGKSSVRQESLKMWREDKPYAHGQVHVLIHSGQMYIIDEKKGACDRARAIAGLSNLYRAIIAFPNPAAIPNVEFIIDIEDTPTDNVPSNRVVWAWNRPNNELNTWIMPDFDGWAFPDPDLGSYTSFRNRLQFYEKPFEEKDSRVVWRGALNNPIRNALIDATKDKEWADVGTMNARLHMAEFCKYQYPIHTEGNAWSGRLRYLQNCNSITLIHDLKFMAHYYDLLEAEGENQNYIHVKSDFSDLEEKIKYYQANPELAQRIAANSVNTFRDRYLTPAAEACYWRRMIRNWAEVQAFEPEAYHKPDKSGFRKQRGIDWELWMNPDPNFRFDLPGES